LNVFPDPRGHTPAAEDAAWRERAAFAATVLAVVLLSWWWIVAMARDMYGAMTGPSAWMMTSVWDGRHLLLLWTMWAAMMAAMMLPSAWPMLTMYGTLSRRASADTRHASYLYLFSAGYVLVWALFSAAAAVVQRILAGLLVLSPMAVLTRSEASAALLILAGVYQLTPLKRVCLRSCRSPISFLLGHWRAGSLGAFRMGIDHGAYCVGCCWALMLLLFVGGVMNLYVIAALTTLVVLEKTMRGGEMGSRLSGGLLIALALWILVSARVPALR
jgi:predicted metal-binding membrane protein